MPGRGESEEERLRRIAILNARLPKKRTIAQGLLRNPAGQVLLCELSYKKEWDLPGGVVDPGESPATCVEREIEEELGLQVTAGRLLAVNWLPPWRGWEDAMLYLFDLGVHADGELDPASSSVARSPQPTGERLPMPARTSLRTPLGCWRSPSTPSTRHTSRTANRSPADPAPRRTG